MAKQIGEDTKVTLDLKTIGMASAGLAALIGMYFTLQADIALAKELLGIIRSKYASLPIPNAETTLDGDTLRTEAAAEKEVLMTQLREMLEQTSRKALLEADKDEAQFLNEKLAKVPYPIYIG